MTNEEILTRVIARATENGFTMYFSEREFVWKRILDKTLPVGCMNTIIFSHDFARAFWGDEEVINFGHLIPKWRVELMQLALAEDRLTYLAKFL